ncbi:MAG: DNA primase [Microgenomates group bacterium Gr01-1014_7]|nr:MAG: DNA primase [Microgenomates group bacterium Gr01-1014_7]
MEYNPLTIPGSHPVPDGTGAFGIIVAIMDETELIKEKLNIVDLIQEYLPLKKTGINFKARCPFHNEKTPSFVVSPERQIFKCFGCNVSGDIFTFLMEKEGMDFKEALEILAKKAGVVLTGNRQQATGYRERLFEVNLKSQEFFHYILTKHKLGKKALEYLTGRGISDASIEEFGLGYAPNSWESLTGFLLKRGFKAGEVVASGVAVASGSGGYDRFRGRITFPLVDGQGKLRGFSGRVLYAAEPKYINTPQTPIFDKSKFLFGINLAKQEIRNKNEAVLVEGETDVILSHQAGSKFVVACKGTALTEGQIDLLKKYAENLSLCFDMDLAGDSASRRGIEMADKAGLNIKVVELDGGKDAAEVIKEDVAQWEKALADAVPIYDYYLYSTAKRYDIKKIADLKRIGEELIPVWAKITDDLVRDRYIQKLAAFLKTDEQVLRESVERMRKTPQQSYTSVLHQPVKQDNIVTSRSRRELLEEYLIALLLHSPKDFVFVPNFPETTLHLFLRETLRQIYVFLVLYLDSISFKSKAFDINEFASGLPKELTSEVDRLYLTELDSKLADEKKWQKEVDGVIGELKKALIKASLEKLSFEIKNAQEFGKMEIVETLNKRFRDLSVKLKNL